MGGSTSNGSAEISGAQAIAATLRLAGVDTAFGLPGVHNMALWPHLRAAGIRVIGSRHEQGTVYAADGLARTTGRLGVAITTTGPGAANAVGATGEAWASKSPVLVISTDIPTWARRPGVYRGFVHECVDQQAMFAPVTKRTVVCRDQDRVADATAEAIEIATAPPMGPVYLEFPADLFEGRTTAVPRAPRGAPARLPSADTLADAAAAINSCERPLIWVGGGARGAGELVEQLAERIGAQVLTTFQARGLLPHWHPLLVNLPPHEPAVTELLASSDLVVVIGSDLDQMMTQAWRLPLPALRVAINVDPADATKNYAMSSVIAGDASAALAALLPLLEASEAWAEDPRRLERRSLAALSAAAETATGGEYLRSMDEAVPPEATVFADMAVAGYWLSGYHRVARPRALHYPMGWGTLGFALPASIGAAAAGVGPVVSVNGDGGVLFGIGELAVAAEEQLPLTVVVVDDGGYGMLRYGHGEDNSYGTELATPNLGLIATGFGLEARSVAGVGADFARAVAAGIASGRPNLVVTRARLTPPLTTSPRWPLAGEPVESGLTPAAGTAPGSPRRGA
jgi:thiamine pyrophosphate-dependent acetolactate synthase large subunit-like protein